MLQKFSGWELVSECSKASKEDLVYQSTAEAEVVKNFSPVLGSSFEVPVLYKSSFAVANLLVLLHYIQNIL